MKKISMLLALSASLSAFAGIEQAPPTFTYKDDKAIFVDFQKASYEIVYDAINKTTAVVSTITFEANTNGYPIFDLVAEPVSVTLNSSDVSTEAIKDPDQQTTMRIINKKISKGLHTLTVKHSFSTNVVFADGGVGSGFWMSDLNDRRYLEQYLPTNLEFDQYQMDIAVTVLSDQSHILKANGEVTKIAENNFQITFPEFYSASSMYFHLMPEKSLPANVQFYYQSIDGRMIPVDIYTIYDPAEFARQTKMILAELENDYGPFPHNQLIIYGNAPSGGMEHSGATITSLKALGHELMHSYHARALMPANGNAGWMDEAIARLRDNNYPLTQKLNFESTRLAGRSVWTRMTDRMAYTEGSAFLSWISYRMSEKGLSFKTFLRDYFEKYKHQTVTTEIFRDEMSQAAGMDLTPDFKKYIYGQSSLVNASFKDHAHHSEDPNHPIYTKKQLENFSLPR